LLAAALNGIQTSRADRPYQSSSGESLSFHERNAQPPALGVWPPRFGPQDRRRRLGQQLDLGPTGGLLL